MRARVFWWLEEYERAKARGATILAELCGYGMTSDAADMVNPSIEGASSAMQIALDDAGLSPGDIDYINAPRHGDDSQRRQRDTGNSQSIWQGGR